ncbi:calcium-binding protein [Pseudomonas bohemica]|uniref:calcium-binding protein n=1 Tax=Pseudomonas bohemica TaxID=2044872 RepID=UPI000DA5FE6B|nr:calcium-binding protein [Pseudomonas bohemica]
MTATTFNWTQLDIQSVTNLYLYGQLERPADIADAALIERPDRLSVLVDTASFMESGPGRFALGANSAIVQQFFADSYDSAWMEVGHGYTAIEMASHLNIKFAPIDFQHWAVDDQSGDYWDRVYVWNSAGFKISSNSRFVLNADGTLHITDYAVVPRPEADENFDFKSTDGLAGLINPLLESFIDPWGIGRRVDFKFTEDVPSARDYTLADFNKEKNINDFNHVSAISKALTLPAFSGYLPTVLENFGITSYLQEGRAVVFGSIGDDVLTLEKVTDIMSEAQSIDALKAAATAVGMNMVGGKGNDKLVGEVGSDILQGGDDSDSLDGKGGQDELYGDNGDDTLVGGRGDDLLVGGSGLDRYEFNTFDGRDKIIDDDGIIVIDGVVLSEAKQESPNGNVWEASPFTRIVLETEPSGKQNLIITYSIFKDSVTIEDYHKGSFGLDLKDYVPPPSHSSSGSVNFIIGDRQPSGGYDQWGNTNDDPNSILLNRPDHFWDTDGLDSISGLTGDDVIHGVRSGDDTYDGGEGNDAIIGNRDDNLLIGGEGKDAIFGDDIGDAGNDLMFGFKQISITDAIDEGSNAPFETDRNFLTGVGGDDTLVGSAGDDVLMGGEGDDWLLASAGNDLILGGAVGYEIGSNGDITDWSVVIAKSGNGLPGSTVNIITENMTVENNGTGNKVIYGGRGDDTILGGAGHDYINSGSDDDDVYGGGGDDTIFGGAGNDHLHGDAVSDQSAGKDLIYGGDGNDVISGGGDADELYGGVGSDTIYGDESSSTGHVGGDDLIDGGDDSDLIYGMTGNDFIRGGGGQDTIYGDSDNPDGSTPGNDTVYGGLDADLIVGEFGDDNLHGDEGDDIIWGDKQSGPSWQDGHDRLEGGSGNDQLVGGGGNDTIYGGEDNDTLIGGNNLNDGYRGSDDDYLDGGNGNDLLIGDGGNDMLIGGAGDDILRDLSGDNVFFGGSGNDTMIGGSGHDVYLFSSSDGSDVIMDAGGVNVINFGPGFELEGIKVEMTSATSANPSLRISGKNGSMLSLLGGLRWSNSIFNFSDGVSATYTQLLSLVKASSTPIETPGLTLHGSHLGDQLEGFDGNDILDGGKGNDILIGGAGDDTYLINVGDGVDEIRDSVGINTIKFGVGITKEAVSITNGYSADGSSIFVINYPGGSATIQDGMFGAINKFEYSDGTIVPFSELIKSFDGLILDASDRDASILNGGDGADTIYGSDFADNISGGSGNDIIVANSGDDQIFGGAGDDDLSGGSGNDLILGGDGDDLLAGNAGDDTLDGGEGIDAYVFEIGMGNDVVMPEHGVSKIFVRDDVLTNALSYVRSGNDLVLQSAISDESLTLRDYYAGTSQWLVSYLGLETSLFDFLENLNGVSEINISGLEQQFKGRVKGEWAAQEIERGLKVGSDGNYHYIQSFNSQTDGGYNETLDIANFSEFTIGSSYVTVASSYDSQYVSHSEQHQNGVSTEVIYKNGPMRTLSLDNAADRALLLSLLNSGGADKFLVLSKDHWIYYPEGRYETVTTTVPVFKTTTQTTVTNTTTFTKVLGGDEDTNATVSNSNSFSGGAGNDSISAVEWDDSVGSKIHIGTMLLSGGGNNLLTGATGDDYLISQGANDTLIGGGGQDIYVISGSGSALIFDHRNMIQRGGTIDQNGNYVPGNYGHYDLSVDHKDTVVFEHLTSFDSISLSWGEVVLNGNYQEDIIFGGNLGQHQASMIYATLDITLQNGQVVRLVMPHPDDESGSGIEYLQLGNGEKLALGDVLASHGMSAVPDIYNNGALINGNSSTYMIAGGSGNDTIIGGQEVQPWGVYGETIFGGEGSDLLVGGDGGDFIIGGKGADTINGGAGDDTLGNRIEDYFGAGNDYYGGTGNDSIFGTEHVDRIAFNVGDGRDVITDLAHLDSSSYSSLFSDVVYGGETYTDWAGMPSELSSAIRSLWAEPLSSFNSSALTLGQGDILSLGLGIQASDLTFEYSGLDLTIHVGEGDDSVTYTNWAKYQTKPLDKIQFSDGTVWDIGRIKSELPPVPEGYGPTDAMTLSSHSLDNNLIGTSVDDYLIGSVKNDHLFGGNGNDVLSGGIGDDTLEGGAGADTYIVGYKSGKDIINLQDDNGSFDDTLQVLDIAHDGLWFAQHGNDLTITQMYGDDSVTVSNWFGAEPKRLKQIVAADGAVLLEGQVQNLVDAMSSFSGGFGDPGVQWGTAERNQLEVVIATSWS